MAQEQKKVIWSDEAKEEYRQMAGYLYDTWSEAQAEQFTEAINAAIQRICQLPRSGKALSKLSSIRRILVRPHTALYYSVAQNLIFIVNLRDTRQDSEGLF